MRPNNVPLKQAAIEGHPPPEGPDLLAAPIVNENIPFESQPSQISQEWIKELSQPYRNPNRFEEFNVAFRQVEKQHTVVSSEGTTVRFPERYSVLVVEAVRRSADGEKHASLRSWVVQDPTNLLEQASTTQAVNAFTDWLIGLDNAPQESDYLGPVIFEAAASAELFEQAASPLKSLVPHQNQKPQMDSGPCPSRSQPQEWAVGSSLGWSVNDLTLTVKRIKSDTTNMTLKARLSRM